MSEILTTLLTEGPVDYARYIEAALYSPKVGYYIQARRRVGRKQQADFYTAESLGAVFAHCVIAAADTLLGDDFSTRDCAFVEIAAEPGYDLLNEVSHPFKTSRVIRRGDELQISGPSVVFANEWLDALPFHRLCFHAGRWRECGVYCDKSGHLRECFLPAFSPQVENIAERLPATSTEGYRLDLTLAAEAALQGLLSQPWTGVLLVFDYGKRWEAITRDMPQGSARTYYQHTQGNDLLANPGQRDITCDVIWDPLEALCQQAGCSAVSMQRQESFFMHHAGDAIAGMLQQDAAGFSPRKQTLLELLHPGNMGHRFQVLSAKRSAVKSPPAAS